VALIVTTDVHGCGEVAALCKCGCARVEFWRVTDFAMRSGMQVCIRCEGCGHEVRGGTVDEVRDLWAEANRPEPEFSPACEAADLIEAVAGRL